MSVSPCEIKNSSSKKPHKSVEAFKMKKLLLLVLMLATIVSGDNVTTGGNWLTEMVRAGGMMVSGCRKNLSIAATASEDLLGCVEARTLRAMDRLLARDVLELPFGVKLIKDLKDHGINHQPRTSLPEHRRGDMLNETLSRAAQLLRTHSLRIPFPRNVSFDIFEGRRRRQKNEMMGLMLFGVMAMSVIAIPLGFQFLAVLGGKALMLAKLALILTSIQGLKKIATSNFSYGLYQAPVHSASRPWLYDRRWQPTHDGAEQPGLFDGFDAPESHSLEGIRPRIMLPRHGFTEHPGERL